MDADVVSASKRATPGKSDMEPHKKRKRLTLDEKADNKKRKCSWRYQMGGDKEKEQA